jgi:hypothetical protein
MFSNSIHLPANDNISFFFMAAQNSIVYRYHIFFTPSIFIEMEVCLTFFPGWLQTTILPISASRVAGIAGMSHHTLLIFWF